jgi:hypothetical protein
LRGVMWPCDHTTSFLLTGLVAHAQPVNPVAHLPTLAVA